MADDSKYGDSQDSEIREIREEYTYAKTEKAHIREEGDTDMRYIAGDPLEPEDRAAREELSRPIVTPDELGQYVNQLINDVRQNKRGIRVAPANARASTKTAELRQGLIRQIEYRSNAALDADPVMFENAAQRGYGYLRIKPFRGPKDFDYELRIESIPNPNMVVEDPHALSPTGKDWKYLYFSEMWSKADAKRRWKNATRWLSFDNGDAMKMASDWVKGDRLLIAERWRIATKPRKLILVQLPSPGMASDGRPLPPPPPVAEFEDELDLAAMPRGWTAVKTRMVDYPTVKSQIVNGVEVLEEFDFPGTSIPFVACYGKILYLEEKKHLLSLIRLARSPYMLYCYYRMQQAEMAAQIPKTPIGGYKGQFAGFENDFERLPHEPMAFVEFNFEVAGWNPNWGPMPPPQRIAIDQGSHLQALELCAEGARRAIQAAIGASPLPTQAQRQNEKSGVALKQIEDTAQKGSFHFIDHFDAAKVRTGEILDELLPFYYDAARKVTVRQGNDEPTIVNINDPDDPESVSAVDGLHDVTISVGPRQISEREAASEFADTVLNSELMKLLQPEEARKVAALAIRLKAVGPIGDEMADILNPEPPEDGKPTPEMVQGLQQQVAQLQQQLEMAVQALETEQAKHAAQIEIEKIDAASKLKIQEMKNAADILKAEIAASVKGFEITTKHQAAHESQALNHTVTAQEAERDRQHASAEADRAGERDMVASERAHEQALEQGAAASEHAMAQQANQAALQPPETGA